MCSIQGPPPRKAVPTPMPIDQPFPYYLDHNATTPLSDEAWEAMAAVRHAWGNPSSLHPYGLEAKYHLDLARSTFQSSLGADSPDCVIFTGSGTEANNLALVGTVNKVIVEESRRVLSSSSSSSSRPLRNVILTTVYEHPAIEEVAQMLEQESGIAKIVRCGVDSKTGLVDVADFEKLVKENIGKLALVSVMHANNELGTINPIADLVAILRRYDREEKANGVLFHTDASQTVGKIDVHMKRLGVDLLTVCAHKFYGPKGVGALIVRDPDTCTPHPVLRGAKHERGIRPSTENVMQVTAAAAALKSAVANLEQNAAHAKACRDALYAQLRKRLVDTNDFEIIENGSVECALPNTLNVAVFHRPSQLFVSAARMIQTLSRQIAMSSGSACHASDETTKDVVPVSAPLLACGCDLSRAVGTLRLSTGKLNRLEDMPRVAQILAHACKAQMPQEYHRDDEMPPYMVGKSYSVETGGDTQSSNDKEKDEAEQKQTDSSNNKPAPPSSSPPDVLSPRSRSKKATLSNSSSSCAKLFDRLGGTYTIPTDREELLKAWWTYGTEPEGSIDRALFVKEFMQFEEELGLKVTKSDVESVFKRFDRNHDDRMSWFEFHRFMLQRAKQ